MSPGTFLTKRRYGWSLTVATIAGMVVSGWSTMLMIFDPLYQGLPAYGGSEEAMYLIRTQEALLHPFTNVTNGIWSGSAANGMQSAGIEQLIGALFWWTGFSAPWLVFFLHIIIAPMMIPLSAALIRRVGAGRVTSLLGAIFLFWFFVYCRRFFHPGFSLPLVIGTLVLAWRWYEKPSAGRAVALGIPLGFAVGAYLWAWTFLWPTVALIVIGTLCEKNDDRKMVRMSLPWLAISALLVSVPAFWHLITARLSPLYAETSVRVGLVHSYLPESAPRSILITLVLFGALWIFRRREDRRSLLPLLAILGALAIVYNQQLVHGMTMSFSPHYIHFVSVAFFLLTVAIIVRTLRSPVALGTIGICLLVMTFNWLDTPGRSAAFRTPSPMTLSVQHLASAVKMLRTMKKSTLLSDINTADIIASYTHHDVVFTEYSGFLLTSDEENVDRACLSELFAPTPIDFTRLTVYEEEWWRVLRGHETEEEYRRNMTKTVEQCRAVRADPKPILMKYGITHLLWNERARPEWIIDGNLFSLLEENGDWSLWIFKD